MSVVSVPSKFLYHCRARPPAERQGWRPPGHALCGEHLPEPLLCRPGCQAENGKGAAFPELSLEASTAPLLEKDAALSGEQSQGGGTGHLFSGLRGGPASHLEAMTSLPLTGKPWESAEDSRLCSSLEPMYHAATRLKGLISQALNCGLI